MKEAWQRQKKLKEMYSFSEVPSISEIDHIINDIKIGKIDIDRQSKRAKALFSMYYLTACRASEIVKVSKLRRRRLKVSTVYEEGIKKKIYELDHDNNPVIENWIEEHNFLGTRKCDIVEKVFSGFKCLEIRTENRKNKNRKTKLLPLPIEKEGRILKYIYEYLSILSEDQVLFPFSTRRAAQIINGTTGFNLHFIRHIRATHLITLYDFNEQMLIKFMGWSDSRPAKHYIELRSSDIAREFNKGG